MEKYRIVRTEENGVITATVVYDDPIAEETPEKKKKK